MATMLQAAGRGFPAATFVPDDGSQLSLSDIAALAQAPRIVGGRPPGPPLPAGAGQFWNLSAKVAAANQIYQEELHRIHGHNNSGDAMRHAEASRRLADAAGPMFAGAAGLGHEFIDFLPSLIHGGHSQPLSEGLMDLKNNSQGINASVHGLPIDPAQLQTKPISLTAAYAKVNQTYQDASPDGGSYDFPAADRYDPDSRFPPY
jgi:hypothetical protein